VHEAPLLFVNSLPDTDVHRVHRSATKPEAPKTL